MLLTTDVSILLEKAGHEQLGQTLLVLAIGLLLDGTTDGEGAMLDTKQSITLRN